MPFLAGGAASAFLHHVLRWRKTIETFFLTEGQQPTVRSRSKVNGFSSLPGDDQVTIMGNFSIILVALKMLKRRCSEFGL